MAIKTSGKIVTNKQTYILKGVEKFGDLLYGNGYCFDTSKKEILFVETIDGEIFIEVEKKFESKKEYLYEKDY